MATTEALSSSNNAIGGEFDAYLVAAVRGERYGAEYVLRTIRPLVIRYCRAHVRDTRGSFASADDVVQEVCMAVLSALTTYQDRGKPFLAFVYGIAAHKVVDFYRSAAHNRSRPVGQLPDAPVRSDGPEERVMRVETARELDQVMRTLSDTQREILLLRVINGLSADQTARAVGSTPGAVRVTQHRTLAKLRKAMTEDRCDPGALSHRQPAQLGVPDPVSDSGVKAAGHRRHLANPAAIPIASKPNRPRNTVSAMPATPLPRRQRLGCAPAR